MWKAKQNEKEEPISIIDGIESVDETETEILIKLSGIINNAICEDLLNRDLFTKENLIIDLNNVTYLSSAGIKMLSQFGLTATPKNVKYKVINVSEYIAKILNMTGYASSFTFTLKDPE